MGLAKDGTMRRKKVKQLSGDFKEIKLAIDETRIQMIQMLIPLGLEAINDLLQQEVAELVGHRYQHSDSPLKRWGANSDSAYLGDQKVQISVPRVRDMQNGREVPLKTYEQLKGPSVINNSVLANLINGVSCRKYEKAAQQVPETFGIKKSSVSERFIQASAKKLKAFQERDLSKEDIIAIFMDGKTFAENEIVVAMGVKMNGERIVLGGVETATENTRVIVEFLKRLIDVQRLCIDNEILFIVDGAKGLHKGIKAVFGKKAIIQRCQWHKRENVVSYLPKIHQDRIRKKLQDAYQEPTYLKAKASLMLIRKELLLTWIFIPKLKVGIFHDFVAPLK